MEQLINNNFPLPSHQQAIRERCFHPSGACEELSLAAVDSSVPEQFKKVALKYFDKPAVCSQGEELTYSELDHQSKRLAWAIRAAKQSTERPVAILMGHRAAVIAALLAVHKSGNCYVVLDPTIPDDRLQFTLKDSTADLILTEKRHSAMAQRVGAGTSAIICIEDIGARCRADDLHTSLNPTDIAYIAYTSGSTGTPKGVVHTHRNVLYSAWVESNQMHIGREDRVGLLHGCSSSATTKYILGAMLNGASLHLFDPRSEGLDCLRRWLEAENITICEFAPSLFRSLARSLDSPKNFPTLRLVGLGAEAATPSDVDLFQRYFDERAILRILFASSETATIRSYFVASNTELPEGRLPIGYPIVGKSVELLDETGHPVAPGEIGEIAVKSRYLAVGYWRRPEETSMKFSNDPRGGDERVYLTGDMGQMDAWGCLVHLGRKDQRLKVRGFTVDPLEAQQCLEGHPAVKSVAVIGTPSPSGDLALAAYWVPISNMVPTTDELRRFLLAKLPPHAIPSRFVKLAALPCTANGKLDRRALPELDRCRPDLSSSYLAPRNSIETELAALWGDILSIEPIGIDDNFLDLGGHSLAASRIISRVVQAFRLELPVKALFGAPTVAEMARIIGLHQSMQAGGEVLKAMLSEIEAMTEGEAEKQLAVKTK